MRNGLKTFIKRLENIFGNFQADIQLFDLLFWQYISPLVNQTFKDSQHYDKMIYYIVQPIPLPGISYKLVTWVASINDSYYHWIICLIKNIIYFRCFPILHNGSCGELEEHKYKQAGVELCQVEDLARVAMYSSTQQKKPSS